MRCEELHNLLTAWVDGEIGDEQAGLLTAHTEQCADCLALVEDRREEQKQWRATWQTQAPDGLRRKITAKPRRSIPIWIPWAAAAALVLMLSPWLRTGDDPVTEAFAKPCNLITQEAVGADRILVLPGRLL